MAYDQRHPAASQGAYQPAANRPAASRGAAVAATGATGSGEQPTTGKKLLSDVSLAQITASALAAVTSMLFSSQIGLAGSVIGVAASAAVTALSGQIYKNFLTASKEKAKAQFGTDDNGGTTTVMPTTAGGATSSTAGTADGRTQVYGTDRSRYAAGNGKYSHKAAKAHSHVVGGSLSVTKKKWFAIVALTVVGLLTVFITASAITAATNGEGLGTKTTSLIQVSDTNSTGGSSSSESDARRAPAANSGQSTSSSARGTSSTTNAGSSSANTAVQSSSTTSDQDTASKSTASTSSSTSAYSSSASAGTSASSTTGTSSTTTND